MNSHIVEKTMHSIKNIDRLTDLAAIDVYNTTHDTINKYEIMKEHATEEYTNESFYQESVLAGVLIGAGVLGVAISAFFIIKKIIDTKAAGDSSVKSSDGKPVAANVDLRDPKSVEKYKSAVDGRIKKLSKETQIKLTKKVNTKALNNAKTFIGYYSQKLIDIIDNNKNPEEIKSIIEGIDISNINFSEAFITSDEMVPSENFIEASGLNEIVSLSGVIKTLLEKINEVEKKTNKKASDKNNENAIEIPEEVTKKLKDDSTKFGKLVDGLVTDTNSYMAETDKSVAEAANQEAEAKKKTEEPAENPAGAGAAENKTEPEAQPQQTVNQNPNGINIKDMDNIIRQASYDGISKDIAENICKNVIDDISSNNTFNVANRVKDEAIKLKADQKLYFTDAAKRILRVYANAIADIEPQTDVVKKYAEDVKQASEMDLSLIEPPVFSRGNLESPKEYANKVATLIKQIPGAIPNKAKELAESEYGNSEKNDIANDIAKQLDDPEATNFRNAYASIINGSATDNIDENQLSSFGDAAAAVNTNNSVNQQDRSKDSQNSATSPQESINAINEDITRAIENARLSDTAKRDLYKISGENIINPIDQSIEQMGGKQAQPEQVCTMVNGTLCNRVYKLIHDAIIQDRKFLQRPVFNTMSKYGEAVTTLCSQVRDICAKMLVSYYNIPVNMVDQIVVPFESYKNNKNSVMYKWFREYEMDVIRDKKIQMIMESQQQEEQKSE